MTYALAPRRTVSLTTRDGVRLDADLWRPADPGRFPVLLMRQPYGRDIASTVVWAHPAWYAAQGYVVIVQDVRGRGTSEGSFVPFAHEAEDGAATVDWAAALPDTTGRIGMYGFSYQGMTQLFAAAGGHPALACLSPAMAAFDTFADFAYEGGAFRLHQNLMWGAQMAAEQARRAGDFDAYAEFIAMSRVVPVSSAIPEMPDAMWRNGRYSHYPDWLANPQPGPFWGELSPIHVPDTPMLLVGGWFDFMLGGTLALHRLRATTSRLVVGPWTHLPWGRRVGGRDFGPAAARAMDRLQLAWFDHCLKGGPPPEGAPVQLYEMGGDRWRGFDAWPAPAPVVFHLASDGLAATDSASGRLEPAAPPCAGEDRFVFDPFRPTPSEGGHTGPLPGPVDRAGIDQRADVVTYTGAPLAADLHLAGDVVAEIVVDCDRPSFDLCAVLSDVTPEGKVWNLTQGIVRVVAPQGGPVRVDMRATCAVLRAGHRLRLSLSAGAFPAYAVNPGTGARAGEAAIHEQRVTTLNIRHGRDAPSRLLLPVVLA
jgi:putative CocE/NonD family hydrolase